MNKVLIENCLALIKAYKTGKLGQTNMPEDSHPKQFRSTELQLAYFTLPMSLNYQRDSYKLWEAALKTYNDVDTKDIFDVAKVARMPTDLLKIKLLKYKLALQPNKHIHTWQTICYTIYNEWGSIEKLIKESGDDFLKLKNIIQQEHKKGFPYLSGPKIFNYWSFIIQEYGGIKLNNSDFIEIAPDTHITKCSVRLGVISEDEANILSKDEISTRWRELLHGSGINPIDMHPPLWFWSRNGFIYKLEKE